MKLQWSTETKLLNWYDGEKWCKELMEGGYDDWRMPNIDEIITSKDILNKSYNYWSDATLYSNTSYARSVDLYNGYVDSSCKTNILSVRAVRTVCEESEVIPQLNDYKVIIIDEARS
jgi:hypothetical protein